MWLKFDHNLTSHPNIEERIDRRTRVQTTLWHYTFPMELEPCKILPCINFIHFIYANISYCYISYYPIHLQLCSYVYCLKSVRCVTRCPWYYCGVSCLEYKLQEPPYVTEAGDAFKGYIPELLKLIGDKTGKKFNFQLVGDGKYGSKDNGQWNGMIGEVISGVSIVAVWMPVEMSATVRRVRRSIDAGGHSNFRNGISMLFNIRTRKKTEPRIKRTEQYLWKRSFSGCVVSQTFSTFDILHPFR